MTYRLKRLYHWTLLFVSAAIALGCTTNPVTGKREISFVSLDQQIQIGEQNYIPSQQSQGGEYYLDPDLNTYVSNVGQKLVRAAEEVADLPDLPYEFVVLNNGVPNAWALPGGKIAINRGLLVELEDESELAAVLGHEIVHAAAAHGAAQMSRSQVIGVGAAIAAIAGSQTELGGLINAGSQLGAASLLATYGRDDELESDEYGMIYMSHAGYDPQGAVGLQETFVRLSGNQQQDFISGLFASHPPSQSRVDANIKTARSLPAGGTKGRDTYQRAIAQITKDQAAYEAENAAIQALNNKNPREALNQLDRAVAIQPDEGQFWELRGHAWEMLGENDNALKAYTTAIGKNEDYFQHWLARGLLHKEAGRDNSAEQDLLRSQRLLPTAESSFFLGELVEARGDARKARDYYSQAASAGGNIGGAAQSKLIRYDLPESPNKYIASGFFLTSQGELMAAVENRSDLSITGISVRVTDKQTGRSRDYPINATLNKGEQANTRTGLYGLEENFNIVVVTAKAN